MSRSRENYCKLLGLNPYKKYSDDQILAAIDAVKAQWEKDLKAHNKSPGQLYQINENLKMIPSMTEDLKNPVSRDREFEEAKKIIKKKLSGLMRKVIVLTDGRIVIPPSTIQDLKDKMNWNVVSNSTLKDALGDIITTFSPSINYRTSEAYKRMNELDTHSPVELLNKVIRIKEMNIQTGFVDETTSPDNLRRAYGEAYSRIDCLKANRFEYQDLYYKVLLAVKNTINTDEGLDELNRYCLCMRVLGPVFQQMEDDSGIQFSRTYIDGLLKNYASNTGADLDLCIELMEEFCIKRVFPANFSKKESSLGTCPKCKTLIFSDPNCFYCPGCGFAVNSICPSCGRAQTANNEFCVACGINIETAVNTAKAEVTKIKDLLSSGKVIEVSEVFGELSKNYPSFDLIPQIEAKIKSATEKVNEIYAEVETDYVSSRFFALKKAVENGLLLFPHLLDREDIRSRYEVACEKVALADNLCVEAAKRSEEESRELYIQASEFCLDHPECVAKLRNVPPDGPADAKFECTDNGISISYSIPEDRRGVRFCIYRNSVYPPEVDQSTTPLFETDKWVFTDNTAEPGIEYYYRIYSRRWGILSQEYAECGPAVLLNEVTDTKIEPVEDGLKIMYTRPAGCSRVRIWRKASDSPLGEEDEIFHNDTGVVFDIGLQSGMLYHYLFVTEYEINGNSLRSNGTTASGHTADLPTPVEDLTVTWDRKRNCYIADWTGPENTFLYYALSKSDLPEVHTTQKTLSDNMVRIDPLNSDDELFRFKLPVATVVYVCPVIKVGNTFIRGRECVVADLRPFKNLSHSVEGRTAKLTLTWPEDAENLFAVVSGKNPDGTDDISEYTVSRNEYDSYNFFAFPLKGSAKTKVTVFAEYSVDEKKLRSIGRSTEIVCYRCSTIRYSLSLESVKGDRKVSRVRIKFSCDNRSNIPRCVMVVANGFIPLRAKDGKVIWESDEPVILLDGSTEVSFVTPKEKADLGHMRIFFADKEDYNKCHFMHPIFRRD